jgi:hypothetical protein
LQQHWRDLLREGMALLKTFNPGWRLSDRPEGMVDWGRTLARLPVGARQEYVIQSSHVGLTAPERAALLGWARWISAEWRAYRERYQEPWKHELKPLLVAAGAADLPVPADDALRSWLHIARRSRWPLLRNVVAESMRAVLEPQDVESVPLPASRETLFELFCLVSVLKAFVPRPDALRWVDRECTNNRIELDAITVTYQKTLSSDAVLASSEFADGLADAHRKFVISPPNRIDLHVKVRGAPAEKLQGIVIECKSGQQAFAAAVPQLKVYRAAVPRGAEERLLVWGIVEQPADLTDAQLSWMKQQRDETNHDVWAFSSVDNVERVLEEVFPRRLGVQRHES